MKPSSTVKSEAPLKFHLHFNEILNHLEITHFLTEPHSLKQYHLTPQNMSQEVKLVFKTLKRLHSYLNQFPGALQLNNDNYPKIVLQAYLNKKILAILEFDLISNQSVKSEVSKVTVVKENEEVILTKAKVSKLQQELSEKNKKILELQTKIGQLESTLKLKDTSIKEIEEQNKALSMAQKRYEQKSSTISTIRYENENMYLTINSAGDLRPDRHPEKFPENQIMPESRQVIEKGKDYFESSREYFERNKIFKKENFGVSKSSIEFKENMYMPRESKTKVSDYFGESLVHRVKLQIDTKKEQNIFVYKELGNDNKLIEKVGGKNLGYQVVFQNSLDRERTSYFRIKNYQVKNNLLFVGVVLENKKKERFNYYLKECVSLNCANGCIWAQGKSHNNTDLRKQFVAGEVLTVVVSGQQKMVYWFIDKKIVAIKSISQLYSQEFKHFRINAFIGMEGVGDKVQLINDDFSLKDELKIDRLLRDQLNKSLIDKYTVRESPIELMADTKNRDRKTSLIINPGNPIKTSNFQL